jgi:hypothetical protein
MIHGVGEQTSSFAEDARYNLRKGLREKGWQLHCTQVHWAPLADRVQRKFLKSVEAKGSRGNMTQKLVVGTLADALMYRSSPELQQQIFHIIDQQIWMLGEPVTIFAHSLGGLIATDYLRARPSCKNVKLVTFGCNIGLFTLGANFDCPQQLRRPNSWVNLYAKSDMLGFPVAVDPALKHVQDVQVSVGRWWQGWTGLAHVRYWDTDRLWRRTIPKLLGI